MKRIEDILTDPCPEHPYAPMPCVMCRGIELGLKDRRAGRGWRDRRWVSMLRDEPKPNRRGLIPPEFDQMTA